MNLNPEVTSFLASYDTICYEFGTHGSKDVIHFRETGFKATSYDGRVGVFKIQPTELQLASFVVGKELKQEDLKIVKLRNKIIEEVNKTTSIYRLQYTLNALKNRSSDHIDSMEVAIATMSKLDKE